MAGDKKGGDDERTVFGPADGDPLTGELSQAPAARPSAIPRSGGDSSTHRAIQVGDVLNHIFEVKRFIARGGMGEVFEGINVNSDERVAIKVMLASLAADEKLLAMFRKEARTLTRLNHPALVQYRVLAQEPQLGAFYIVTEFVDGRNLADVIQDLRPTPQDLINLTRRLAGGLDAAHALGAIHRDISPDNVMLEDGQLAGAKIIDFGIAKDLNAGTATIIGDGFAGKLNYVAPEQLGDFDRSIGPWTDVYSLGLVILAVAAGRDVDMGGTLVNAVDKRRTGPDLSPAPEELQPVLARMLKANPKERLRSMGDLLDLLPAGTTGRSVTALKFKTEVIGPPTAEEKPAAPTAIDLPPPPVTNIELPAAPVMPTEESPPPPEALQPEAETPAEEPAIEETPSAVDEPVAESEPEAPVEAVPPPAEEPATSEQPELQPEPQPKPQPEPEPAPVAAAEPIPIPAIRTADYPVQKSKSSAPLIVGGAAVVLLLAAAGLWFGGFLGKGGPDSVLQSDAGKTVAAGPSGDSAAIAKVLGTGLGAIGCSWLDVADLSQKGGGTVLTLSGVSSKPADVQGQISRMLAGRNLAVSSIDLTQVAPIEASECGPLDALRQIRDPQGHHISVAQRQLEMTKLTTGDYAGSLGAMAVVNFDLGDPNQEMALFGIEPSGKISQLTKDRAELVGASEDLGGGKYRLTIDVNHTGWSGLLLLTGAVPFDGGLTGPPGSRTGDWSQRFLATAKERGWKSEMVWFKTVNDQPD